MKCVKTFSFFQKKWGKCGASGGAEKLLAPPYSVGAIFSFASLNRRRISGCKLPSSMFIYYEELIELNEKAFS
ncbi:hypothetical protein [Gracilibacillus saliphilus]|uniref:hypothetical protein n=1 Tax=Gracilibacillus saliphilus TaxID=543890 RepID=UPI0013D03D5F|nr:hypothetical protein [Gracilibacillus saliphilus]